MSDLRPWRLSLAGALASATVLSLSLAGVVDSDNPGARGEGGREQAHSSVVRGQGGSADGDLADQQAQYAAERTAPALTVSGDALLSAAQQAAAMPVTGGAWQEFTNQPYTIEPPNYTDPFWSNLGSGFSLVGGRTTSLAVTANGAWFAGAADGGGWRSTAQGQHRTPPVRPKPSLSIHALAVNPLA